MNINKALLTGETLLDRLRDPNVDMSVGDKLAASLQVTVLGVVIVVLALLLLYFAINIMEKFLHEPKKAATKASKETAAKTPATASIEEQNNQEKTNDENNEELVAVITAAIAASMETSTHNIIVRNIVRTPDTTPAWGRAGRAEQINQMHRI